MNCPSLKTLSFPRRGIGRGFKNNKPDLRASWEHLLKLVFIFIKQA